MLLRVYVVLPLMICENEPTAYIVLPHCTSWRICWMGLLALDFRCGVPLAGVADTTPGGGCSPPAPCAWAAEHADGQQS